MRKLLTPSDFLLLGIGKFIDILEEIRDPLGLLDYYYTNIKGLSFHRYKKQYLYQTLWRNLKTKNIEKVVERGRVYFKITRQGEKKIKDKFPLLSLKNNVWDEQWRFVIYDIEEIQRKVRKIIQHKLQELGFAQFQKSVWISPHDFLKDLYEFFEERNLLGKIALIETKNFFVEDIKEVADKLWHLKDLNEKYYQIYQQLLKIEELKEKKYIKKWSDRTKELYNLTILVKRELIETMLADPFLPEELLPDDWYGDKVMELTEELELF